MTGGRGLAELKIKLFADGADLGDIHELAANPHIRGFTTNPTLMRKAGVRDYRAFAEAALKAVPDRPISFEIFADAFDEMEIQALEIASWGPNVYVKIPVTNTRGESAAKLVARLSRGGVKVNVTAMMTATQIALMTEALAPETPAILSLFAGRVADSGRDPMPIMAEALETMRHRPKAELLWASPRELLNILQADAVGCHIITATRDVLKKLPLIGKDLEEFSLETVKMFHDDALSAGYEIETNPEAAE